MREYIYPDNCKIYVSDETVNFAPVTFSTDGSYFEPNSIEYFFNLVKKQKKKVNIADIGAQVGLYTLYSKNLDNSFFYSFEPNPEAFCLLEENCKLNNLNNVKLFKNGLGEHTDTLNLLIPYSPSEKGLCCFTETPLRFNSYIKEAVEIITLDSIFFDNNLACDFIKCDTEGYELKILKGGEKTLKAYKPELFIEVNETNLKQCNTTRDDLFSYLFQLGYELVTIKDNENYHFTTNKS